MATTTSVNGQTVVHKDSGGVVATTDVCKTPVGSTVLPIPYVNIARSQDTENGSKTVKVDGNPIMLKGSYFSKSCGDEAGTAGGVGSGVTRGKAKFVNYSFDAFVEGRPVCRRLDPMVSNIGGSANTPPAPLIQENAAGSEADGDGHLLPVAFIFKQPDLTTERRGQPVFHTAHTISGLDEKHNRKMSSATDKNRVRRGWGGVMWGSYGDLLITLQEHRWPEPICHCFEMPVHAFGYNWCASNYLSGQALRQEIDRIIDFYRGGPEGQVGGPYPRICNSVILVTHSMGGLVARSACMLHGAKEKVLGVVHGVQPATGSPAAYWRMKAGFERPRGGPTRTFWDWLRNPLKMAKHRILGTISAVILGTDGEEVTSLLGNMPGGLELLPTKDYIDNASNSSWLSYPGRNGDIKLPALDPYKEIYLLQNPVYRMVNPAWLDPPGNKENQVSRQDEERQQVAGAWDMYKDYLLQAQTFHEKLGTSFHTETYQFYGTDLDSPDNIAFSRRPYAPHHPHVHYDPPFLNKGTYATYVDEKDRILADGEGAVDIVILGMPDGKGDGTVPISSGNALRIDEGRTEMIGTDREAWFSIGHQDICSTPAAQQFIFESVSKILQKYIEQECGVSLREATV